MKTVRLLFMLLPAVLLAAADAAASSWVNEFLVHRTPSYTADGAEGCLHCHSGEKMRSIAQSAHGNAENPHAPAATHGCESCHGPGSIHVSRAHGGRGFPPLTTFGRGAGAAPRDEQLDACLGCHAAEETGTKPIVFRGSVHDRGPINCSTCHQAHSPEDPMADRAQQQATCFRCHAKIKENHPQVRNREVNFERISCGACHKVHDPAPKKSTGGRP